MAKFRETKTTLWGVFYVGNAYGSMFRSLKAGFADKTEADAYAKKYSKENFGCTMTVKEVNVTVPAWDGSIEAAIVANPLEV